MLGFGLDFTDATELRRGDAQGNREKRKEKTHGVGGRSGFRESGMGEGTIESQPAGPHFIQGGQTALD